jgi:hypothetical protein
VLFLKVKLVREAAVKTMSVDCDSNVQLNFNLKTVANCKFFNEIPGEKHDLSVIYNLLRLHVIKTSSNIYHEPFVMSSFIPKHPQNCFVS